MVPRVPKQKNGHQCLLKRYVFLINSIMSYIDYNAIVLSLTGPKNSVNNKAKVGLSLKNVFVYLITLNIHFIHSKRGNLKRRTECPP
jgi:hypothetical protein